MALTAAEVWRDYVTNGVPSSGNNKPKKSEVRSWGTWLEENVKGNSVANLTALKAVDTGDFQYAFLRESGRGGAFVWVSGNFSSQIAADTLEGVYIKADAIAATAGAWVRASFLEGETVDVGWFAPDRTGATASQAAFSAACKIAVGRDNSTPAFSAMPKALDVSIVIPDGLYHLTGAVDTDGKAVTYITGDGVKFTAGSAGYLNGRVDRGSRSSLGTPFGLLDHATGESVMVGGGSFDNSPLVTGLTNPNQISTNETIDLVGRYTDVTAQELLHSSAATYTATTCVLSIPVDVSKLRVGMVLQTRHSPTVYRAQVTGWSADGGTITVANGWYLLGSSTATTPSSTGSPIVDLNPFHKVWGQNTNAFLTSTGYAYQAATHEIGIWNNKVAPANGSDPSGQTWGNDVVNLGPLKCSLGYIVRGDFWEGYRATGVTTGFRACAYGALGYAAPSVGFEYQGGGTAFQFKDAAGNLVAQIFGAGIVAARNLHLFNLTNAANDAAAAVAGVGVSEVYRNGSQLMIRVA